MTAEPVQRFVESQRLRISYWDWGNASAPTLILVHGGRDHARSWDRIAEAFCDRFHVVAPDLRGHGDSEWTPGGNYGVPDNALDIVRVIEEAGSPATVIAHSYGGSISLVAAGTFPEHVSRMVVMEGTHSLNPPELEQVGPALLRQWGDRLRGFEGRRPQVYPSLDAAAERMMEANPRLPNDFVPHLAQHASKEVDGGYAWKYDLWVNGRLSFELRREELPAFWEAIECPVLLMTGSESLSRQRQHPNPAAHFRDVRTVEIEGAGHWMHHDQPEQVIAAARRFLEEATADG